MNTTQAAARQNGWLRIPNTIGTVLSVIAGIVIMLMMLSTVIDVILRKFFQSGLAGTFEYGEIALTGVVFLAIMSAELTNTHVRSPVLIERVPALVGNALQLIALVIGTLFIAWMAYLTTNEAIHAIQTGEFRHGIIFVPTWPAKIIIPIGLVGLTIALLIKVVDTVHRIVTRAPAQIIEYDNPL